MIRLRSQQFYNGSMYVYALFFPCLSNGTDPFSETLCFLQDTIDELWKHSIPFEYVPNYINTVRLPINCMDTVLSILPQQKAIDWDSVGTGF
jgi:hypothetical protein